MTKETKPPFLKLSRLDLFGNGDDLRRENP